jgi:hypothetical protein
MVVQVLQRLVHETSEEHRLGVCWRETMAPEEHVLARATLIGHVVSSE